MSTTSHIGIFVVIIFISLSTAGKSFKGSKAHWWNNYDEFRRYGNIQYFSDFFMCMENSFNAKYRPHPLIGLKMDAVIKYMGYPVERIKVETDDGYILTVFRIPYSPKSPLVEGTRKKPIYMNHGLTASGQQYLIQWGDRNLGMFDIPTVMKKITELTGEEKMYYVGHSMGTTTFMVAFSEIPELNKKIHLAFLLTPAAYMKHASNFMKFLTPLVEKEKYLEHPFLGGKVETLEEILEMLHIKTKMGKLCTKPIADCFLCNNMYFMIGGFDGRNVNLTEVPYIMSIFPDLISTKSVVHYAQNIAYGTFRKFDYGKNKNVEVYGAETPEDYDLSKISAPTVMMHAENDELCSPPDVKYTASKFGNNSIKAMVLVEDKGFTHSDFATAKFARELVYDKIIHFMKENENKS